MLEVEEIHSYYGLSHILFGVSLKVNKGEVVCLLGRNGAGKSTTMKSIIGLIKPREGKIIFKGEDITGKEPYLISRKGIGYIPDDRRIFADLTVGENLEIAMRREGHESMWNKEKVYEVFPKLKEIESRKGGYLSGGEQKMLAIARALMGNPEFLLLDEPFEGLAPLLVHSLEEKLRELRNLGLTLLIAEQNVRSTLRLSDRGYIIDDGHIRYHGSIDDLRENEEIRKRYLLV